MSLSFTSLDACELALVTGGAPASMPGGFFGSATRVITTMSNDAQRGAAVAGLAGAIGGGVVGGATTGPAGIIPGAFAGGRAGITVGTVGGAAWGLGRGLSLEMLGK